MTTPDKDTRARNAPGRRKGVTMDGGRLRAARQERGLTQEQVATAIRVSTRAYQNAESSRPVSPQLAQAVAQELGLPISTAVCASQSEVQRRLAKLGLVPCAAPQHCVGRKRQLESLVTLLAESKAPAGVVCISGPTGIGKSALACVAAHQLQQFTGGVAWISAPRNRKYADAVTTTRYIARALDFEHQLPPPDLVAPAAYRLAFAQLYWQRPRLLVLDDVRDVDTLRQFVPELPAIAALITTTSQAVTRNHADHTIELGPLSDDEAVELLVAILGRERIDREQKEALRLARLLGNVPHHLQVAAGILKSEQYTNIASYADRLSSVHAPAEGVGVPATSWMSRRAVQPFAAAYAELRAQLPEPSWEFYTRLCAAMPNAFTTDDAANSGDGSKPEAAFHLSRLVEVQLLSHKATPDGESTFSLVAPARYFAPHADRATEAPTTHA